MFNIFNKTKEATDSTVDTTNKHIKDVCVDEYSKILMIKNLENININLKELFNITQEAKKELHYELLSNADKYNIEKFQDLILFIARDYRNLDKLLPKE